MYKKMSIKSKIKDEFEANNNGLVLSAIVIESHNIDNEDNYAVEIDLYDSNGQVKGNLDLSYYPNDRVECLDLWLDEDVRGSGTGRAIVRSMEDSTKRLDAKLINLKSTNNTFWEHMGYKPKLHNFYKKL
jgi:GNAT superfamily N-acetyltransferase